MFKLWKPQLEEGDDESVVRKKAVFVAAKGHFSYAIVEEQGKPNSVYSWGMGESYVLGNRSDDNEFYPHLLKPKANPNSEAIPESLFDGKNVKQIVCGTQHLVVLAVDSITDELPELDFIKKPVLQQSVPKRQLTPKKQTPKQPTPVHSQPAREVQPVPAAAPE